MSAHRTRGLVLGCLVVGLSSAALAQTPVQPQPTDPNMPSRQNTVPEKIEPGSTGATGGTLSERLNRTDGVITPPSNINPGMSVPAPVPDPGTTPVIKPGETTGGAQPK